MSWIAPRLARPVMSVCGRRLKDAARAERSDACANQTENVNARASFGGARRAHNAVGDSRRASEHKVHLRALNERSWSLKSAAERSSSPTIRLCSPIAALRSIVARSLSSATASMHLR